MARKILNRETAFAVIPGLLLAVYFFWNTPVAWDLGGHIQAARDFSKYIFPYFAGWNPHQLMGYPQGYFYPSLLYWLSSLPSSLGLPAETAFKALISLSLILLPVSWLSLLNSLKISSKVLAVILLWWVYFIPKGHIGGDFWGLFRIGLANQSFAVPFVFFYWAACCRDTPRVRELSFWLSLTILSHAFMALAAAVGGFLWIYQRGLWRTYWIHAGLCFGLCALWIVPYLLLSEYGTGVSIPISSRFFSDWATDSGWILGVAQIAAVALLILRSPSLYKSSQWKLPVRWMAFWFLALAVLMFADLQMQDGLHLPVHLYRLIILGLYVSMIPLSGALMKGFGSQNVPVGLALMLAVGSGAKALLDLPQLSESADLKKPFHVEDRILVNLPTKIWPGTFAPHFMTNHLANDGHSLANGLFVESSRNSILVFVLVESHK